jgi:protein tyrosine/serine phosphatase
MFLLEVLRVTLGSNFHTVVDQCLYRAAQPTGAALESYVRDYGIHTVINLRGPNQGEDWFDEEEQAAKRQQVEFVSVNISASDKPQEQELRQLIRAFDDCPTPILVHCYSGSDRSGFASACYLLLCTKSTLEEARSQLSLRFGHFPWGKAGCLNQVLDQYKEWLVAQGIQHQPDRFRHWVREVYQKDDWPK